MVMIVGPRVGVIRSGGPGPAPSRPRGGDPGGRWRRSAGAAVSAASRRWAVARLRRCGGGAAPPAGGGAPRRPPSTSASSTVVGRLGSPLRGSHDYDAGDASPPLQRLPARRAGRARLGGRLPARRLRRWRRRPLRPAHRLRRPSLQLRGPARYAEPHAASERTSRPRSIPRRWRRLATSCSRTTACAWCSTRPSTLTTWRRAAGRSSTSRLSARGQTAPAIRLNAIYQAAGLLPRDAVHYESAET